MIQTGDTVILYSDIMNIQQRNTMDFVPNGILVTIKNNVEYKFVVHDRDVIIEFVKSKIITDTCLLEKHEQIIDEFIKKTSIKSLKLTLKEGEFGLMDSKFGGVPYMPKGFKYPHNGCQHLRLLAQLNFNELHKLDNFPQKGILQFFIDDTDDDYLYGLDSYDLTEQTYFRVIYHENIVSRRFNVC